MVREVKQSEFERTDTMREEVIRVLQQAQDAHSWAWAWLSDIIGYIERYADSFPEDLERIGPTHQSAPEKSQESLNC